MFSYAILECTEPLYVIIASLREVRRFILLYLQFELGCVLIFFSLLAVGLPPCSDGRNAVIGGRDFFKRTGMNNVLLSLLLLFVLNLRLIIQVTNF